MNDTMLSKVATSDMNRARKYGEHLVGRTKFGIVTIIFDGTDYELLAQGKGTVATGKGDVKQFLMNAYVVVA